MENQTLAFAERTLRDHLALLPKGWGRNFEIATGLSGGGDYSYRVRDGKARFTGSTPGNVLLGVYDYLRAIGFVFLYPGKGGQLVRSAGVMAQLMAKENGYALVRLPSGEMRNVPVNCTAVIGQVSNIDHENVNLGKAGRKRHMGVRPGSRGTVMNPCDHPHGGGEGRAPVGHSGPMTPWGKPALGLKTRKHHKRSDKLIVKRAGK